MTGQVRSGEVWPSGRTRLAAVIGSPVRHSMSPAIHNAAFAAAGLDWAYVAFEVADGSVPEALAGVRALGIEGLSVTMPHKAAVAAVVDELTDSAARLDAVNCVVRDGGRLVGHNTDGDGFVDSIRAVGVEVGGLRIGVIGAGGAARSVIAALGAAGAREVLVVNRTAAHASHAASLSPGVARTAEVGELAAVDLVVNATSVGMGASAGGGPTPLPVELLHSGQTVCDLVYQPLETPLLVAARERGATTVDGLGMLVHQAARAFELWTGHPAPLAVMNDAVRGCLA